MSRRDEELQRIAKRTESEINTYLEEQGVDYGRATIETMILAALRQAHDLGAAADSGSLTKAQGQTSEETDGITDTDRIEELSACSGFSARFDYLESEWELGYKSQTFRGKTIREVIDKFMYPKVWPVPDANQTATDSGENQNQLPPSQPQVEEAR